MKNNYPNVFQTNWIKIFVNWNLNLQEIYNCKKLKATPISGICNAQIVTKPRGIKYLGIKISRELEEIHMLNMAPLLQNIRNNLDKWGKIQLTLWGKVNIIKMVVSSRLYCAYDTTTYNNTADF